MDSISLECWCLSSPFKYLIVKCLVYYFGFMILLTNISEQNILGVWFITFIAKINIKKYCPIDVIF